MANAQESGGLVCPFGLWDKEGLEAIARARKLDEPIRRVDQAVQLRDDDLRPDSNLHVLMIGPWSVLRENEHLSWLLWEETRRCEFAKTNDFYKVSVFIQSLFRMFYTRAVNGPRPRVHDPNGRGEQKGLDGFGWVNITGASRSVADRSKDDPKISLIRHPATIKSEISMDDLRYEPLTFPGEAPIPVGRNLFAYREGELTKDVKLVGVSVPHYTFKNGCFYPFEELWFCLARPEEKEEVKNGRIPALIGSGIERAAIRTTPFIVASRVDDPGSLSCDSELRCLSVEIHPKSGRMLSIRLSCGTLENLMLPVPHELIHITRALELETL